LEWQQQHQLPKITAESESFDALSSVSANIMEQASTAANGLRVGSIGPTAKTPNPPNNVSTAKKIVVSDVSTFA
jgi:hypothetical protein